MRFRKSIKIIPGVRVNFSKSGISTTIGTRGLSINSGKNGVYLNTGIPGTGFYDRKRIGGESKVSYSSGIREAKKAQRELEKKEKEITKLNELQKAELEVKTFENYIDRLISIHKDCHETIDWIEVSKKQPPQKIKYGEEPKQRDVIPIHKVELFYRNLIENYRPNFFEKIIGKDKKNLVAWEKLLSDGIIEDKKNTEIEVEKARKDYAFALEKYKKDCEEIDKKNQDGIDDFIFWTELARKINIGDLSAYATIIETLNPFEELSEFGSDLDCTIVTKDRAKAVISINDDTVIPKQSKTLLKSGKVSIKEMPIGRFNEIYQDFISSAVLRMARDLFSILPFEKIIVTAIGNYLNSSTGNEEEGPLLSVLFDRQIFETMNFELLDPSDSMKNFKYNMEFKKTKGMACTEEVDFEK